jgi:hypothetical protein
MDLLFTLLLCSPYPAIGLHTARGVLRQARTRHQPPGPDCGRLRARTWLYAAAMVVAWPAVEVIPPTARLAASVLARLRRRTASTSRPS